MYIWSNQNWEKCLVWPIKNLFSFSTEKYWGKICWFVSGKFVKTCLELDNRFQTEGFFNPICVLDKDGLGMKIPDKSFGIGEVRSAVGSRRLLDVMNVNSKFVFWSLDRHFSCQNTKWSSRFCHLTGFHIPFCLLFSVNKSKHDYEGMAQVLWNSGLSKTWLNFARYFLSKHKVQF